VAYVSETLRESRRDRALLGESIRSRRPIRVLVGLELFVGGTALIGGLLLAIAPDGSLLAADPAALHGSPFTDYRLPGLLLAALVGGGYLLAGWWQRRAGRGARALSVFAGAGLVTFEGAEVLWLGFQPLEAVFVAVGGTVAVLALITGHEPGPRR
jgi:peptidoglycan/LPS O-acetylase OafA/YrhL